MVEIINTWFWCTLLVTIFTGQNYFLTQIRWITSRIDKTAGYVKDSLEYRRETKAAKEQKTLEEPSVEERLQTLETIVTEEKRR